MRKISLWAKNHKQPARLSIVLIYIFLNGLGISAGILLHQLYIGLPSIVLSGLMTLFITVVFLYPSKYGKGRAVASRKFYNKQKTCDFILGASTFCIAIFLGNRPEKLFFNSSPILATVSSSTLVKDSLKTYKNINSFSVSMKDKDGKLLKWKERKKLLKEQVREIKKAKELSNASKVLLAVLSVIVALGLIALVAGLACNLSCSGSDGAALLVGIGGLALVIFLLVLAIRGIYGKKKRKHMDAAQ